MSSARVIVVGGGFSGTLAALHLLSRPEGPRVSLLERGLGFGVGLAYGACAPEHLLNVRAGNMSAFPGEPDHFVRWLRAEGGRADADGAAFATRQTYGVYLQQLLREAATTEGAAGRLELVGDEAVSLSRLPGGGVETGLAKGRTLAGEAAVLALGNLPPPAPRLADAKGLRDPRYLADPWVAGAFDAVEPHHEVLLLGSGLTMVDVVVQLTNRGHAGPLLALSRHGLLPHRHAGAPGPTAEPPPIAARLSRSLGAFRREVQTNGDWRATFDSLRPLTQGLWARLDEAERRRFLRHLRPYWDIHRHRLAPSVADQLEGLARSGRLQIEAGRLQELRPGRHGLFATLRPRGAKASLTRRVDWLVNCTGPEGDIVRARDPLLRSLLARGLARPDPLQLGIDVDADRQVIDAHGRSDHSLTAIGPITRAAFWETTAAPDIRVQAAETAAHLIQRLR